MICEKCPAAFLCFGGVKPQRCQLCSTFCFYTGSDFLTVRCSCYPQVYGERAWLNLKLTGPTNWSGCARCKPLDHFDMHSSTYRHVDHYHHGRDGSILSLPHTKWCKRQAWWTYRDLDEGPPGFPVEKPAEAP